MSKQTISSLRAVLVNTDRPPTAQEIKRFMEAAYNHGYIAWTSKSLALAMGAPEDAKSDTDPIYKAVSTHMAYLARHGKLARERRAPKYPEHGQRTIFVYFTLAAYRRVSASNMSQITAAQSDEFPVMADDLSRKPKAKAAWLDEAPPVATTDIVDAWPDAPWHYLDGTTEHMRKLVHLGEYVNASYMMENGQIGVMPAEVVRFDALPGTVYGLVPMSYIADFQQLQAVSVSSPYREAVPLLGTKDNSVQAVLTWSIMDDQVPEQITFYAIQRMPTAMPAPKVYTMYEWYPVKERPPKPGVYLAWMKGGNMPVVARYDAGAWHSVMTEREINPIRWMMVDSPAESA